MFDKSESYESYCARMEAARHNKAALTGYRYVKYQAAISVWKGNTTYEDEFKPVKGYRKGGLIIHRSLDERHKNQWVIAHFNSGRNFPLSWDTRYQAAEIANKLLKIDPWDCSAAEVMTRWTEGSPIIKQAVDMIIQHFKDYYNNLEYYRKRPALLSSVNNQILTFHLARGKR